MFAPIRAVIRDPEGKVLLVGAASMVGVGTVAYHFLEGWSLLDSLYFSVVTLATVGYGDLTPTTVPAKLFTVAYITVGIGIVAAFASELTKFRKAERLSEEERAEAAKRLGAGLPAAASSDPSSDAADPAADRQER
jgi:voltage-gated potassium channel